MLSGFLWMQFNVPLDGLVWSQTDSTTITTNKTTLVSPHTNTILNTNHSTNAIIVNNETKKKNVTISILVELTGELGNHLHHLAHGRAIQRLAMSEYGIPTRLVLHRSSNAEKYRQTQRHLQRCFPNLREYPFHHDDSSSITIPLLPPAHQESSGNTEVFSRLFLKGGSTYNQTRLAVEALNQILEQQHPDDFVVQNNNKTNGNTILSFPFIHTSSMINREFMDIFYHDFREFFAFDDDACCSDLPGPDEAVFVSTILLFFGLYLTTIIDWIGLLVLSL
jgi:hypothetical protein